MKIFEQQGLPGIIHEGVDGLTSKRGPSKLTLPRRISNGSNESGEYQVPASSASDIPKESNLFGKYKRGRSDAEELAERRLKDGSHRRRMSVEQASKQKVKFESEKSVDNSCSKDEAVVASQELKELMEAVNGKIDKLRDKLLESHTKKDRILETLVVQVGNQNKLLRNVSRQHAAKGNGSAIKSGYLDGAEVDTHSGMTPQWSPSPSSSFGAESVTEIIPSHSFETSRGPNAHKGPGSDAWNGFATLHKSRSFGPAVSEGLMKPIRSGSFGPAGSGYVTPSKSNSISPAVGQLGMMKPFTSGSFGPGNRNIEDLISPSASFKPKSSPRVDGRRTSLGSSLSDPSVVQTVLKMAGRYHCLHRIYHIMEEPESHGRAGALYVLGINLLLLCSSMLTFLHLVDTWQTGSFVPFALEIFIDVLFTIEVIVRFVCCPSQWLFLVDVFNLCDIVAGLPPLGFRIVDFHLNRYEHESITGDVLLGVVPVLRYLKLLRRFEKLHLLIKAFKHAFDALPVLLFFLTFQILAFAAVFYVVEPRDNIPTLGTSWYAVTMTLTTVGYGDVHPVSTLGQIVMCILSIESTLYLAIPLGIVGRAFSIVWEDRDRVLLFQRTRKRLREMGLTAHDIPSLFRYFDADRDGALSLTEFCHMVSQLKVNISLRRVTELFRLIDYDHSGGIDDEEFTRVVFPEFHAAIYAGIACMSSSFETTHQEKEPVE